MATASPHLLSGLAKHWSPPQFSKEEPRIKISKSFNQPLAAYFPPAGQHPDEEKGRSIRSSHAIFSTTQSTGSGLEPGISFSGGLSDDDEFLDGYTNDGGVVDEEDNVDESEVDTEVHRVELGFNNIRLKEEPLFSKPTRQGEAATWSQALAQAVEQSDGNIMLSQKQLRYIPDNISELSCIRRIPPSPCRPVNLGNPVQSSPSMFSNSYSPSFAKTPRLAKSPRWDRVASSPTARPLVATAVALDIDLAGNELVADSLSNNMFGLDNLRHLWLRQNKLEQLPPGIGRLTNLEGLSLAMNQLEYLPAEILRLENLKNLTLHPNPFLPSASHSPAPPSNEVSDHGCRSSPRRSTRLLGPPTTHFNVLSLREIALRKLLEPDPSHPSRRLVQQWDGTSVRLNLPEHDYAAFASTFHSSTSSLNASTRSDFSTRARHASNGSSTSTYDAPPSLPAQPFDPLANVCRSPLHPEEEKVFFEPAVERFEWVEESLLKPGAGDAKKGGPKTIPIKWRGCSAHCLDWLEEEEEEEEVEQVVDGRG